MASGEDKSMLEAGSLTNLRTYARLRGAVGGGILLAIVCAALGGCSHLHNWCANGWKVGPNYRRPAVQVAERWIDNDNPRIVAEPPPDAEWWTVFNDPTLNRLVTVAYQQNTPLREAAFRVLEARAQRGIAVGGLFPQSQIAIAEYSRNARSANVANSFVNRERFFDQWDAGLGLVWELDLWGQLRRGIEAADAQLDASVENYDSVLVTLIGDIASTYVEIRSFERRLQLARVNADIQRDSLKLAESRLRLGATTELDSEQAKSRLAQTEALVPRLEIDKRLAENRLCILLGMPPFATRDLLGESAEIPTAPLRVAVGVPAELLRRRPDVRQAEREVAAQSARIGIAEAEFYPSLSLTGNIGVSAASLNDLFRTTSLNAFTGPSLRWNILNYGRILNDVRVEDARFQQAIARYESVVLKAHQEVEDALVSYLRSHELVTHLTESARAANRSADLSRVQYEAGAINFDRVYSLQTVLVEQNDALAQAEALRPLSLIRLYKALGGGWQVRLGTPAVANFAEEVPVEGDQSPAMPLPLDEANPSAG